MLLKWGTYNHSTNSVKITIDRLPVVNEGEVPIATLERWTIKGLLYSQDGGPSDINTQIQDLIDAYSEDGKDLVLTMPDGTTPTATCLLNAKTLGGTRVTKFPSFPTTEGVERVNQASYELMVEGEVPISPDFVLISFKERLRFDGGGAVIKWLKPAVGLPVPQITQQFDTYRVIQSGEAAGYLDYPTIPDPIWLPYLTKLPEIEEESPDKLGSGQRRFLVSWKYEFEADIPLLGIPNSW